MLRRTTDYVYPGAPVERIDVAVYSIAFDDLEAPSFPDDVLAAAEAQLEALTHGRADFVFHRRGTVALSGSSVERAGAIQSHRRGPAGLKPELAHLRGDADVLVAFTSWHREHNTSFASPSGRMAVIVFDDRPPVPGLEYGWDIHIHDKTKDTLVHELLHNLGLADYYKYSILNVPSTYLSSIMGLENYASAGFSYFGHINHHQPATAWSKWLLGWLNGSEEALCITVDGPTRAVLRPHQQVTLEGVYYHDVIGCHEMTRVVWGPATARPTFAIVPTSDTTALVIEADPLGGDLLDFPRCGDFWPPEPDFAPNRKAVGAVIVYSVDTTVPGGQVPLRVLEPTQSLITEAEYEAYDRYTQGRRLKFGREISAANAYATELVVAGYRITVAERTVADDGLAQVTVVIEPA